MTTSFRIITPQQLTEYVRALRKSQGLTQADVAKHLGVSKMRVAAMEKDLGRVSTHRLITLITLLGGELALITDAASPTAAAGPMNENSSASPATKHRATGEW